MSSHRLITNPNGTVSVEDIDAGESMHSFIGPWAEAQLLYAEQSRFSERLSQDGPPLVIWDVGMGIAANALAAIDAIQAVAHSNRSVEIVSFESKIQGIELALQHPDQFDFLVRHREKIEALLAHREWISPNGAIHWTLHKGIFEDHLGSAPAPELIYYDFYSPKSCPELWTLEMFKKVRARCGDCTTLLTYSAATRVRVAMLLAGFFVGNGSATETKTETTIAATQTSLLSKPLERAWLDKVERSDKAIPVDALQHSSKLQILEQLQKHPQFNVV